MKKGSAQSVALGGVLASLGMVIMSMGTLIPAATYVCPMLSMILCAVVLRLCGTRIAWAWYGAVTILGMLLSPDKESASLFAVMGYYPIIRPFFEKHRFRIAVKILYFNSVVLAVYAAMFYLFGMAQLQAEYKSLGVIGLAVMLILGNVTFCLLDLVLRRFGKRKR